MKLHAITGRNSYCGPAVISTLTGMTTDSAAEIVRRRTGQRVVKGMYTRELRDALYSLGITSDVRPVTGKPTLNQWMTHHRENSKSTYLVVVTGHFIVVQQSHMIDNHTGTPEWVERSHCFRKRVREVYRLNDRRPGN
jgi:hypothetical protein